MKFRNWNPIFHGWYLFFRRRTFKAGVTRIANQQWQEQGEWLRLLGAMYCAPTGFMDDNVLRRTQPSA